MDILLRDYKEHNDSKLNKVLLWDYNLDLFDYKQNKELVIRRVIERGSMDDWYWLLNYYGWDTVKNTLLVMRVDKYYVSRLSIVFSIPEDKFHVFSDFYSNWPAHL